jgi:glycosyltransferase involved in cell wall biosynthesis
MRILFLTQLFPYPQDNGGKVKTLKVLKILKKLGHEIFLVCFADQKKYLRYKTRLVDVCWRTKIFHHPVVTKSHKQLLLKGFFSLFSDKPFAVYKYYHQGMAAFLEKVSRKNNFDLVYIDHLHLAQYLDCLRIKKGALFTYDEHNISSEVSWSNFRISKGVIEKLAYFLESVKWEAYEKRYLPLFGKILAISEKDRSELTSKGLDPKKIFFLPLPVETEPLFTYQEEEKRILFIGLMSWKPNRDGFWWFYKEIFPGVLERFPQVKLTVIGANPSLKVKRVAREDKNLEVLGYVQEIEKFVKKTSVFIVPIRSGGGVKVKILTALSFGLPVVSTRIGAEGIKVGDGREALLADTPQAFVRAVGKVLKNKKLAERLSRRGMGLIKRYYNQKEVVKILGKACG